MSNGIDGERLKQRIKQAGYTLDEFYNEVKGADKNVFQANSRQYISTCE